MRAAVGRRLALCVVAAIWLAPIAGCRTHVVAARQKVSTAAFDEQNRPTAAAFFRSPLVSHPALSPDGETLAGILEHDGTEIVFVRPVVGRDIKPVGKLERTEYRGSKAIRTLGWGGDQRIIVSLESPKLNSFEPARLVGAPTRQPVGVRARQTRLMVVDLDSGRINYLGKNWPFQAYSQFQDDVIAWRLPDDPDHILLDWWQLDQAGVSARRVNLDNGRMETEADAQLGMVRWHANQLGQVLAGSGASRTGTQVFTVARPSPTDRFEEIVRFDPYHEAGFEFAAFSERPDQIYVWSTGDGDLTGLYTYDLARHALGPLVYEQPEVDLDGIWTSQRDGHLIAVHYTTERPHWHYFDRAMASEQAAIDAALPGSSNSIVQMDRDERVALVCASSDVMAPRWFYYEREKHTLHPLFDQFPDLHADAMSPMKAISFRARDGLTIHGYLTRPRKAGPGPLPTILLPHGGPSARDVWGWDPEVQFLASRGFAVLQLNFRGSTGYGTRHRAAGYLQWGLAMQDDITDAAQWAIAQGIADPQRLGIYGASYGGYAALMALVKTPDLFQAGASLAGVSDIIEWLDNVAAYAFSDFNTPAYGDTSKDREQLAAVSPARQADRIRAPVLIAHGTEDPIVHVNQASHMIDALQSAGREVEFVLYADEVHGFIDERNAIDFYTKLASFFERHLLGPRAQTASGTASP